MDSRWKELTTQFLTADQIPDELLYEYIDSTAVRSQYATKLATEITRFSHQKDVPALQMKDQAVDSYLQYVLKQEEALEVRRRARRDLYFLARYFTWDTNPESAGRSFKENRICDHVHRRLCDMFVKKDNTKPISDQDTFCKERLVLYPRGSMKSTIDVIDTAQWILNFPDIRILFLTAADDLAVGFVDETKGRFVERLDEPTLMNLFFPEFCAAEKELGGETAYQFTCPVWRRQNIRRREATVMASSITSTLSGWHFEVVKADDPVSNRNSENEEQCKKVTKQINTSVRKMLRPYGYFDGIGTRYADEDYWGEVLEKNVGDLKVQKGPCWEIIENNTTGAKILIGRAWEIKPEFREKIDKGEIKREDLAEEHYDLLFPEVLTWSFLRQEEKRDEVSFEGQYNQNPRAASQTPFPRPLLLASTVTFNEMPFRGPTSITWDFAFSKKKGRDYSTASAAMWNDKGVCYITDLIRGRFHHNDLAKAVVELCMKWRPFIIGIEDAMGSRFLEPTIIAEAQKTGQPDVIATVGRIDWVTPDNQKDAKKMRMAALHPWLINGRMKFAAYLPYLDVLYSEFERCLTSHHHDDIPDVISRQTKYAPSVQGILEKSDMSAVNRSDVAWNMLFEEGYSAPSYGWLLSNNPETGQLEWNAPPPQHPIVDIAPADYNPAAEVPAPGLDSILGSGLCG